MTTATDRKALALYPFDGSDPNLILALHAAFRAGAEFAAERAPAWGEETLTNEALLLARAALAQASPSQSTPWVARLVDEVVDSTLAVVREHLPVKPGREAMIEAMLGSDIITDDLRAEASAQGSTQREPFLCFADAVLDLIPGRSEAEVKAEALREHRRRVARFTPPGLVDRATVLADLDDYADRLAAEGGADRG